MIETLPSTGCPRILLWLLRRPHQREERWPPLRHPRHRGRRPYPLKRIKEDDVNLEKLITAGLVTKPSSILLTWNSVFSTNAQSRFASAVFDYILWPLCVAPSRCPCLSVVPEEMYKASWGPLKGSMSAEKALQGSEAETRELLEGTTENSVSPIGVIDLPSRQINEFSQRGKKI